MAQWREGLPEGPAFDPDRGPHTTTVPAPRETLISPRRSRQERACWMSAFEWMKDGPEWQKHLFEVALPLFAALLIGIPMIMVRHRAALAAAKGKLD